MRPFCNPSLVACCHVWKPFAASSFGFGLVWSPQPPGLLMTLAIGFVSPTPTNTLSPSQFMVKRAHEPVESPSGSRHTYINCSSPNVGKEFSPPGKSYLQSRLSLVVHKIAALWLVENKSALFLPLSDWLQSWVAKERSREQRPKLPGLHKDCLRNSGLAGQRAAKQHPTVEEATLVTWLGYNRFIAQHREDKREQEWGCDVDSKC